MSRKYQQKGYLSDDSGTRRERRPKGEGQPTGRVETRYRRTIRCAECSATVTYMDSIQVTDKCRNCDASLHTCRNCRAFDSGAPNQCLKPVTVRVEGKGDRNTCELFTPKILVEKMVEERKETTTTDSARKAFDDLFKI